MMRIAIVGSGFSGSVIARELAERGYGIELFESRPHLAGNCHTTRDPETGVMLHVYGPHIFHTSNEQVWAYIQKFGKFMPFINRVKAHAKGRVYSLPVNLMTINQLFGKQLSPAEAREFIASLGDQSITDPQIFEEQALRFVGREIYEAFFRGYTRKQWGVEPSALPASILKRLPVRFNYDDNYYTSKYQGIPVEGYTSIIERMLDHPNIRIHQATKFTRAMAQDFGHVFYSGPIDSWFEYAEGQLGYRTLDFKLSRHDGDYQGNAVINYCGEDVPWTRIAEHKHFAPWEQHEKTIISHEHSRLCGRDDTPYYPLRLVNDRALLERYVAQARAEQGVTFVGRLGTYRYLDMHVTIEEALNTAKIFLDAADGDGKMPAFCVDPLA